MSALAVDGDREPEPVPSRTVSVVVPVLDEAEHLAACLDAIVGQDGDHVVEILVVDGGSRDATVEIATAYPDVRVLDNPRRLQAAAMNVALREAAGEVVVRVDGHCRIARDYVARCVAALDESDAAMVGGRMDPRGNTNMERAVALALDARWGAGGAAFHAGSRPGFVDTVYLGAYPTDLARRVGGYREVATNEDAELAIRMQSHGGVWFDPVITATYTPRGRLRGVARQFLRYGLGRAATVRRHPRSLSWRQLAAPALVLGLVSPRRRDVAAAYVVVLAGTAVAARRRGADAQTAARVPAVVACMHLTWGVGFLVGVARPARGDRRVKDAAS